MEDTECPTCGREFATRNAVKGHHTREHGESLVGREVIRTECSWCGDEFERVTTDNTPTPKYCSMSCANQATSDDGICKYSPSRMPEHPQDPKRAAVKRDDWVCHRCGEDLRPGCEVNDCEVHVHHVIPERMGGYDVVENLVCLCSSCHGSVHGAYKYLPVSHPELFKEFREAVTSRPATLLRERGELSDLRERT